MSATTRPYRGLVRAPDFAGYEWITGTPRSIGDLQGQLIILDFWTYCCINCMQMLPALHRLEGEFPGRVAVIGVEAAKFSAEQVPANVAKAIERYGISHPVINDPERTLWDAYTANAWPTLMFIDPAGKVWGRLAGELDYDSLRQIVSDALNSYVLDGTLVPREPEAIVAETGSGSPLWFPGKVLVDTPRDRLIVSDTGHHRLLVMSREGQVSQLIGSGAEGRADGSLSDATFSHPEGVAVTPDGQTLYVADRANHLLRRVDLTGGQVTTVAGTGERGGYELDAPAPGIETALASPWDLAWEGDRLLIAMAGTHQIWAFDPAAGTVEIVAGTGAESIHDGPLREATFSQPSGIAVTGGAAWSLDSESSAIRRVDLAGGRVRRIVGRGLFDFGDVDGTGDAVRLQHPLGLAASGEDARPTLYIADSYNHRIKRLDALDRTVTTIAGSGEAALRDGELAAASFWEPSGLAVDGPLIYVADTNNHALRLIDTDAGMVTTMDVRLP
jgi:DNA-binding beta-propeller fold protein YncE